MSDKIVPVQESMADKLHVAVYADRPQMGEAAALAVAASLAKRLSEKKKVNMVFAAAPSQNEFLAALVAQPGLDWSRVTAFHLDEYIGLRADAPQRFANYLNEHIFSLVPFGSINYLNGNAPSPQAECARYGALLADNSVDIACIGIGENGHLAFNDPPVADFADPARVKVVELEERCRVQQVHDGCFTSLDLVPTHALTMTMPAIMAAQEIYCIVPGPSKTEAVAATLHGHVHTKCPASILRTHACARLYVDKAAAGM